MEALEFEDAIRAEPENLDLRLVAADWYEEHGDPRAEFIRVQLALQNLPSKHEWRKEMEGRERALLAENHKRWNAPIHRRLNQSGMKGLIRSRRGKIRGWKYQRGFVEELSVDAGLYLQHHAVLRQVGPICTLKLWNTSFQQLMQIATDAEFADVSGLDLQLHQFGDNAIQMFLGAVNTSQIRLLNLAGNSLTNATAETVSKCDWTSLQRLVLSQNAIDRGTLLSLYEQFGDCVQHENGDPVYLWRDEIREEEVEQERTDISYDDSLLYEGGRIEEEYESNSVDRFHGVEELDDDRSAQRPDLYDEYGHDRVGWDDDFEEPNWGEDDDDL